MKKIIIFVSLTLLIGTVSVMAQAPKSFMIKPGIIMAKQVWDDRPTTNDIKYLEGMYVAWNLEFFHHEYFSLLTECGFSMKRNSVYKTDKSVDFLYVAPMLKVRYELGNFIPYIYFGPRMDFMLTKSFENAFSYGEPEKVIFGIISGIDMEYRFKPHSIILGFQNQYDISNSIESSSWGSMKYNAFVITAGIKLYYPK
ncbi:MAG: hypothetical protein KAT76_05250 [Bacteroidales bacterium]|nr:hypothetical protein [Bacteroidales bacterium]